MKDSIRVILMAIYVVAGFLTVIGAAAEVVLAQSISSLCENNGSNSASVDGHGNVKVKQSVSQENDCVGASGGGHPPG